MGYGKELFEECGELLKDLFLRGIFCSWSLRNAVHRFDGNGCPSCDETEKGQKERPSGANSCSSFKRHLPETLADIILQLYKESVNIPLFEEGKDGPPKDFVFRPDKISVSSFQSFLVFLLTYSHPRANLMFPSSRSLSIW